MRNAYFLHTCRHLDYPELCFDIADGLMLPLPWGGETETPIEARRLSGRGA